MMSIWFQKSLRTRSKRIAGGTEHLSHHSHGVRARLSVWLRDMYRHRLFGDSIRFRTNESVVNELLLLKARAKSEGGQIAVFFIDDNFAINIKRTKSLLRDIIAAGAQVHWVAQIQRQPVARRRARGFDRSLRRDMGFHRYGIH